MKKLFSILAIAFAAFAISCNKGDETVIDSKVVGSWAADTFDYHYPIATFNKNGTYVWEWGGKARLKDTGEYTVENGIIEMKISEYYEFEEGEFKKCDAPDGYSGVRTCKIILLNEGILDVVVVGDYFMGGDEQGFPYTLFREGLDQSITEADLKGTWESYIDEGENAGKVSVRLVFDGNNYTQYNAWGWGSTEGLQAFKTIGTWSYSKGVITVSPTNVWYSYETGVDSQNHTVYTYSVVDPVTLEAAKWTKVSWTPSADAIKVYLASNKLYASGVVYTKK